MYSLPFKPWLQEQNAVSDLTRLFTSKTVNVAVNNDMQFANRFSLKNLSISAHCHNNPNKHIATNNKHISDGLSITYLMLYPTEIRCSYKVEDLTKMFRVYLSLHSFFHSVPSPQGFLMRTIC